jgi:hypothetical protein
LKEAWKDPNFRNLFKGDARVKWQFFSNAWEALARAAKGRVHVMFLEGVPDSGLPGSTSTNGPYLQRKGVEVVRVNVDKHGNWNKDENDLAQRQVTAGMEILYRICICSSGCKGWYAFTVRS